MSQPTRYINYGNMLYECLRNYYSVNKAGSLTWLYKILAACVVPMAQPFNDYYAARVINLLVAQCAWQVGQLTNVLNYLFDPLLQNIYIGQSLSLAPVAPVFAEVTPCNLPKFGGVSPAAFRKFNDPAALSELAIYVPDYLTADQLAALTAVVAQIALTGIPYQIITYTP
jgi:hypothetical protein